MSARELRQFCEFWLSTDFFTVGLFAFGGVGLRMAIGNTLSRSIDNIDSENSHEGPYMEIFYTQSYLACNMLGCFIMGYCLCFQKEISALSSPLYKGVTTGFCGSLTTLSSWMNGAVYKLFDRYWYKVIIMIVLQFWLTWAAFTTGMAAGKLTHEVICSFHPDFFHSDSNTKNTADLGESAIEMKFSNKSQQYVIQRDEENANSTTIVEHESEPLEQLAVPETVHNQENEIEGKKAVNQNNFKSEECQVNGNNQGNIGGARSSVQEHIQVDSHYDRSTHCVALVLAHEHYTWVALFAATSLSLWIVLLLEPQLSYFNHQLLRDTFRSVALAPCGAWLRWAVSRVPEVKALWPNMNPHTLIVNITAVFLMCVLLVFVDSSWVSAVNSGVEGTLSTVSTFIAEIYALYEEHGASISFRYAFATIFLSIAVIQIIRGGQAR